MVYLIINPDLNPKKLGVFFDGSLNCSTSYNGTNDTFVFSFKGSKDVTGKIRVRKLKEREEKKKKKEEEEEEEEGKEGEDEGGEKKMKGTEDEVKKSEKIEEEKMEEEGVETVLNVYKKSGKNLFFVRPDQNSLTVGGQYVMI
jgi:hypothetical protein